MAVSNEEDDGVSPSLTDNPFSFKKFVSKRSTTGDQNLTRTIPATKKKETATPEDVLFPEVVGVGTNPFSFKTFMKKQKNKPQTNKKVASQQLQSDSESPLFSSDDDDSDDKTSVGKRLPPMSNITHDKVNDQTKPPKRTPHQQQQPVHDLFAESTDSSDTDNSDNPLYLERERTVQENNVIVDPMEPFPGVMNLVPVDNQDKIRAELKKVKGENEQLKKQLEQYEEDIKKEKKRSRSLMKEMKSLKEKEQKETKALEEMVQKVEENLATANKRSSAAEATIAKLREEIQKLQVELAKSTPQAVHKSYEDLILGVREKANYASQQLSTAAHRADLQIKEMCQGIETLKLVSEILMNIDSSFEVNT